MSEEQDEEAKIDADAKDAVQMENADFTWERTATQDPNAAPGKKQTSDELKNEKKAQKQAAKDEKAAAKLKSSVDETSSGDTTPDDATTLTEDREPFKLTNMNFSIGRNELVAVIGGVGSGKSSLLAALAGDMRRTRGDVTLGASRAFCPQYAWIQNATVKENILFGKDYDRSWYVITYESALEKHC